MKVLHILFDGPDKRGERVIDAHGNTPGVELKVIDLAAGGISYASLVSEIFAHDRVFSWHSGE